MGARQASSSPGSEVKSLLGETANSRADYDAKKTAYEERRKASAARPTGFCLNCSLERFYQCLFRCKSLGKGRE